MIIHNFMNYLSINPKFSNPSHNQQIQMIKIFIQQNIWFVHENFETRCTQINIGNYQSTYLKNTIQLTLFKFDTNSQSDQNSKNTTQNFRSTSRNISPNQRTTLDPTSKSDDATSSTPNNKNQSNITQLVRIVCSNPLDRSTDRPTNQPTNQRRTISTG